MMKYDAILVLGITLNTDGTLPEKAIKRVEKGVEWYKSGVATKIIFSGKYSYTLKETPSATEAMAMKNYAISLGLLEKDIILEENAVSTVTNLYYVKNNILIPNQWRNVLVITEAPHVERVKYNAAYVFGDEYHIDVVASDYPFEQQDVDIEKSKMQKVIEFFSKYTRGDDQSIFNDAMEEVRQYVENNKAVY